MGSAGCCDWGGTGAVVGSVVLSGRYWYTLGNVMRNMGRVLK